MLSFDHIKERYNEEHRDKKKRPWNDENGSETFLPKSKRACLEENQKKQAVIKWQQAIGHIELLLFPTALMALSKNIHYRQDLANLRRQTTYGVRIMVQIILVL
ncbi:hypothetical protein DPV78_011197 [Talaromyces pinophilus]|nr:hypothetical protein DPV78_011197 [Talaromyces pinophilus]